MTDQLKIGAIVVGLIALYPAWLMYQKAFMMSRKKIATAFLSIVLPPIVIGLCVIIPFFMHAGAEIASLDLFIDFVLFAIVPAALVGLVGFVSDQIAEKPLRTTLCAAGCLAVAALPPIYYLHGKDLADRFDITLVAEEESKTNESGDNEESQEVGDSENTDSSSLNSETVEEPDIKP